MKVKLFSLLQVFGPEKPNIQEATDNQSISCCCYMRRSKIINYKVLSENW